MRIVVLGTFFRTGLTRLDASFHLGAEHIDVLGGASNGQPGRGCADICAIEAVTDALRHRHVLCHAGIGAGGAEKRAEHRMARGKDEFFGLVLDLRMGCDH
ncbi:hypothetical protein [Qipengyuania seohaensis]|uniref:hypothetical protein n=1 Tax=Qipengyuania seohaensis TaxID=266951 RepID=UPI001E48C2C4|nr:hypothetical protein [Qipengyuania seohaensis]